MEDKHCREENIEVSALSGECDKEHLTNEQSSKTEIPNKKGIGILLFLFGGFLGLIAGLLLYPINTIERKTFVGGCVSCVKAIVVILVLFSLIVVPLLVEYL